MRSDVEPAPRWALVAVAVQSAAHGAADSEASAGCYFPRTIAPVVTRPGNRHVPPPGRSATWRDNAMFVTAALALRADHR